MPTPKLEDANYKITGLNNFDDLVMNRILFLSDEQATETLKQMFPKEDVHVFTDRGGNTRITVGEVKVDIKAT